MTKLLEPKYTDACLGWQMNIGQKGRRVKECAREGGRGGGGIYKGWHNKYDHTNKANQLNQILQICGIDLDILAVIMYIEAQFGFL